LRPIGQSGQHNGVIKKAPVGQVQATDAITKDLDCPKTGPGPVGHDLNVVCPFEFMVDEESQIAYNLARGNGNIGLYGVVLQVDAWRRQGIIVCSPEEDKFRFRTF